jgi:hypothetical protein
VQVPPTQPGNPSCSAWRNTDSMLVLPGGIFHFQLGLGLFHKVIGNGPVQLDIQTHIVTADWLKDPKVLAVQEKMRQQKTDRAMPVFMAPELRALLVKTDLQQKITPAGKDSKALDVKAGRINFTEGAQSDFVINGAIPKTAKKGDIILVRATAAFNTAAKDGRNTIEFLQVLHVTDKI